MALVAALVLLLAVGFGVWLGYAVVNSKGPVSAPSTTTGTTTTSPKLAAVAAKVDPGLVDVDTTLAYETSSAAGTGMVVSSSGEVYTNNHVVEGETSLHVTDVGDGKTYAAAVIGYDASHDVAVLKMVGASHLHTVSFAGVPAKMGQQVIAIGNAGGKGGTPSAVQGTVTGLNQSITAGDALSGGVEHLTGLIQTNAPIQPGDSGGPLVNMAGKVLGMDTAAGSRFSFPQATTQGFAIPVQTLDTVGTAIKQGQPTSTDHLGSTAFLGVDVTNDNTAGAVVVKVLPGTAATGIGLSAGDTIVSVADRAIRNSTSLSEVMQAESPGDTVSISWQDQSGQSHTDTVTLRSGPPA